MRLPIDSQTTTEPLFNDGHIVVMAASAGGIQALVHLLEMLPNTFQHQLSSCNAGRRHIRRCLPPSLAGRSLLRVQGAREGDTVRPLRVFRRQPYPVRHVIGEPPVRVRGGRFGARAIGVVLSGYGRDGTDGVQAIRMRRGVVIAQDEVTSERFDMPKSAIRSGSVDCVLPIEDIAEKLVKLVTLPPAL
jgi:two-component system, chemotaxis family, protein-glutamate methylesterase/glutaminase